jgi:hypothetical protein
MTVQVSRVYAFIDAATTATTTAFLFLVKALLFGGGICHKLGDNVAMRFYTLSKITRS